GIYYQGSHWYLVAWCCLRKDYRNFRTDKINSLVVSAEKMRQHHPPLQSFINHTAEERQLQKIVIDAEQHIMKYFGEQKYYNGFLEEETMGDVVRMTFLTASLEGFARWFLLFGEWATIIEPAELSDRVSAIAKNLIKKLDTVKTC
ncbi:MAG TPA: WYL domain-containing protein, partial [Flavisolibacter sp.]|nr:WYL domain-containing protein [Flavisolibacter sp.]